MNVNKKAPQGNHPRRRPNPVSGCPLTAAFAAIGGKWKLIIIYWLAESPKHFAAIQQVMPSISQKVLTQQLRELTNDGIVQRKPTGAIPAPVEYSLTDYGRSFNASGRRHSPLGQKSFGALKLADGSPMSDRLTS